MRAWLSTFAAWALVSSAALVGCVVSFEDYPVAAPDASGSGSTGNGGTSGSGASGGIDASSGGSGAGGAAGTGGAAGKGGSGGSTGGSGGSAGASGGVAGSSGVAGNGGVGGPDACVPKTCADLAPQCGELDTGCGSELTCDCTDAFGCVAGQCVQVVTKHCPACGGALSSTLTTFPNEDCNQCMTSGNHLNVCVMPGWESKVEVKAGFCSLGYHPAASLQEIDCSGVVQRFCVSDSP